MAIINDILEGIKNGCPIEVIPDRKLAIERALAFAEKDDLVLIAGKGHEEYQIVGDRKIEFDERKIIKDFLSRKEDSVEYTGRIHLNDKERYCCCGCRDGR